MFIVITISLLVLLAVAALATAMLHGLLSISLFELKRRAGLGDEEARLAYPLRARSGEFITLMTLKKVAAEVLFVLLLLAWLPELTVAVGILAFVLAWSALSVVTELLPRAWLKRYGLQLSASLSPYLIMAMDLIKPLSLPVINKFHLDKTEPAMLHSVEELEQILKQRETKKATGLDGERLAIIRGALNFGTKTIADIMTPRSVMVALEAKTNLGTGQLKKLSDSGHSRFPVYDSVIDKMVGVLFLHELVDLKRDKLTAGEAADKRVYYVNEDETLEHALQAFLKTQHHLFIVTNEFEETVGLVTIEDVIEEIIGHEIVGEFDKFDDMREVAKHRLRK